MAISWNEIKTRAAAFVNEWKDKAPAAREEADAQTFENDFFHVFGVERSKVAIFEQRVKVAEGADGYIDLFWKGHIIVEMKSPGKDMEKAFLQAKAYANALENSAVPKCILICDFVHFHHYDLMDNGKRTEFPLAELVKYVELFGDLAGYKDVEYKEQDAVNVAAAEKMGKLHDRLKAIGYSGHQLEVYLVRLLFCLFADDTGIFEHDSFIKYVVQRTNPDGSDLGLHLEKIFEVLNKKEEERQATLDEQLRKNFPYVNGGLFKERLDVADFDSRMRENLIECCTLDWSKISPAIFGAMFQSVMNAEERRNLGAHYTSEKNILKLIHPLFLDDLWAEFDKIRALKSDIRKVRLNEFHDRLAKLKFLDPACGCGNFLVITYRELRILELEVIKEILGGVRLLDVDQYIKVNVDQFYGIEIEEFPAQIAEVAMWLMDHQMNMLVRDKFGEYYVRIPLKKAATIVCANALTTDWENVVPKSELSYILGNPPFVGAKWMSDEQREDVAKASRHVPNNGLIDYVGAWYIRGAEYIKDTKIQCAFVSTNSITQGEQVGALWGWLIPQGVRINFAHKTFKWSNEARGNAAVHCVIIGFSLFDRPKKLLFEYETITSDPMVRPVSNVSPYLVDAPDVWIGRRSAPLCAVPEMESGNKPIDDGNYLFTPEEKEAFLKKEPDASPLFRRWLGGDEFLNNIERWCLYVADASPSLLKQLPETRKRIEAVRKFRAESKSAPTKKIADTPTQFHTNFSADKPYIAMPEVSSERRYYIPIAYLGPDILCSNKLRLVRDASLYHFGVLTSGMHMDWAKSTCGRLESRYQYSVNIVYNNFPWPSPTDKQKADIEAAAQGVLDARALFPDASLADLYDPDTIPPELAKAHAKLDKLVEKAYGKSFETDAERVAFLFERYQELTAGLAVEDGGSKRQKKRN